uniref:Ion_trans_2 domain-containing protein n=1 Tax=Rhabditophanes sp. KR3021 TaxID=114890 RepID=A0AC35TM44_9BILA
MEASGYSETSTFYMDEDIPLMDADVGEYNQYGCSITTNSSKSLDEDSLEGIEEIQTIIPNNSVYEEPVKKKLSTNSGRFTITKIDEKSRKPKIEHIDEEDTEALIDVEPSPYDVYYHQRPTTSDDDIKSIKIGTTKFILRNPFKIFKKDFMYRRNLQTDNQFYCEFMMACFPQCIMCALFFIYLTIGVIFYQVYDEEIRKIEIFKIYLFIYTTVATIGYGNIVPTNFYTKMFTTAYSLIGIPIIFAIFSNFGEMAARFFWLLRACISSEEEFKVKSRKSLPLYVVFIFICVHTLCGAFLFSSWIEDLSMSDAVYLSYISVTTIGFGDLIPNPKNNLETCVLFVYFSFGISIMSMLLSSLSDCLKYIHKIGRPKHKTRDTVVYANGHTLTVGQLIKVIAKEFEVEPCDILKTLKDLDSVITMAIAEEARTKKKQKLKNRLQTLPGYEAARKFKVVHDAIEDVSSTKTNHENLNLVSLVTDTNDFVMEPSKKNMSDAGNSSSEDHSYKERPKMKLPDIKITIDDESYDNDNSVNSLINRSPSVTSFGSNVPDDQITIINEALRRNSSMPISLDAAHLEQTLNSHKISLANKKPIFSISSDNLETVTNYDPANNWLTLEKLPNLEHYRNTIQKNCVRRPSMGELIHGGKDRNTSKQLSALDLERNFSSEKVVECVYIPSYTNIVGTLLYLRMGFVAGQAGILGGIGIVTFSTLVLIVTSISLSGICSNGRAKRGGLYYLVSRSLGPKYGASIGIVFSLANIGMAGLYIVGIAELVSDLLIESGYEFFTDSKVNDIRVFGTLLLLTMMLVSYAGPNLGNSLTMIFFSLYFLSYIDWIVGTFLPISNYQLIRGVTGLLAGCMYSEELENPGRDVPLGLFTSIATTFVMYVVGILVSGATILKDASGVEYPQFDTNTSMWIAPDCVNNGTCKYGLMNYYPVAELESAWRPLLIAGLLAMTTSSLGTNMALNNITDIVTNLFMASFILVNYACFDASFVNSPGWRPTFVFYNKWSALFGAILCTIVMVLISVWQACFIVLFFLLTYAYMHYLDPDVNWGDSNQAHLYTDSLKALQKLTNHEIHVKNYRPQILLLSGNPASRLPLIDFVNSITKGESLLVTGHVIPYEQNERTFGITKLLENKMNHFLHINKIKAFYMPLANVDFRKGVKNFLQISGLGKLKPNVLMVGFKTEWSELDVSQIADINNYVGILRDAFLNNFGVGIIRNGADFFDFSKELADLDIFKVCEKNRIHSHNPDGNKPITVPLQPPSRLKSIIDKTRNNSTALDLGRKVSTAVMAKNQVVEFHNDEKLFEKAHIVKTNSMVDLSPDRADNQWENGKKEVVPAKKAHNLTLPQLIRSTSHRRDSTKSHGDQAFMDNQIINKLNKYRIKPKSPIIDVWWLFDDGGLTLLIPHLLRLPRSYLEGATLRVFTLASSQACTQADEQQIAKLLANFRIECKDVKVIEDISQKPHNNTLREFEQMISKWKVLGNSEEDANKGFITTAVSNQQKKRTYRELRMRELLLQHSRFSDLVCVTMPVPRHDISSCLYMAWLDALTAPPLPSTLLIRGNQTSVLSFYA